MPIQWTPAMAVGDPTIDEQHRQLIGWLNQLLSAMSQGKGRGELEQLLASLGDYTVMHLGHEEGCFQRLRCPAAVENAAAHAEFIRIFGEFRAEFDRRGATADLVVRLKDELAAWVTNHIKGTDTKLVPCLKQAS